MVNVNKAARGKHRWIGFQTSEDEFSRAKCEDIFSIILPNINWRLFDLKIVDGVSKGILKIPLEEYDFTLISINNCLLYTSPSPRDVEESRMPSSA